MADDVKDAELRKHQLESCLSCMCSAYSWMDHLDDDPLRLHLDRAMQRVGDLLNEIAEV